MSPPHSRRVCPPVIIPSFRKGNRSESVPTVIEPGSLQSHWLTPLTLVLGDHGVAKVLQLFSTVVRGACSRHGGRIVKQIGDAFMLVFDRPGDAIAFGLDVREAAAREPDLPGLH